MEPQAALVQLGSHTGIGAQVVNLGEHVFGHRNFQQIFTTTGAVVLQNHLARCFRMFQPAADQGHFVFQLFDLQQAFHGSAVGMAANHNFTHPQGFDRILDRRSFTAIGRAIGGNDVTGIADHENFARIRLGNQFRVNAGVRTRDEENARFLPMGQLFKQLLMGSEVILLKLPQAFNQFMHGVLCMAWLPVAWSLPVWLVSW